MLKKQPSESDRIRSLFEKNTIRKSGEGPSEPITLSLPDPIEGAPTLKPYRRPEQIHRGGLLPFKQPETRQARSERTIEPSVSESASNNDSDQEAPASSHSVARLARLYELSPSEGKAEPARESIQKQPVTPPSDSPELQSRLRKAQLRLKVVQVLLRVSQPMSERFKDIAALLSESFSLWQVQIHLPVAHRPEQLEVLGSFTRGKTKIPRPDSSHGRSLQKAFEGQSQTLRHSESQHLLLPLAHRSERLGVLEAVFSPAHNLSADDQLSLKSLSEEIGFYLTEERKQDDARALSDHDTLTGLLNHRAFQQQLESTLADAQLPVSLIVADLDFFRQINEVHGYLQGDQVLQQISRMLQKLIGGAYPLARFGGEEFALLLPRIPLKQALELAGSLRQAIASEKINGKYNSSLGVTASLGVACLDTPQPKARQVLLDQTFAALAVAKEKGRNQSQAYQPPQQIQPLQPATVRPQPETVKSSPTVSSSQPSSAGQPAETNPKPAAVAETESVSARKWSEIISERESELMSEWQRQTEDYGVTEVSAAVGQLSARLPRLLTSLCQLLDHKLRLEELEQMPLSYFMPSQIVAEIRRANPKHQLISYEVAFMLLQESLQTVLGKKGQTLQDAVDHFFLCINEKLTALKSELKG